MGPGYQQITRLWKLPLSWRVEFQYAPVHPDDAGTNGYFRLQITPIIRSCSLFQPSLISAAFIHASASNLVTRGQ
jgi:hypothetical protein